MDSRSRRLRTQPVHHPLGPSGFEFSTICQMESAREDVPYPVTQSTRDTGVAASLFVFAGP